MADPVSELMRLADAYCIAFQNESLKYAGNGEAERQALAAYARQLAGQAGEAETLRRALHALVGSPNDYNNGWRGRGNHNLFACEYCGRTAADDKDIEHKPTCPVPPARKALAATHPAIAQALSEEAAEEQEDSIDRTVPYGNAGKGDLACPR